MLIFAIALHCIAIHPVHLFHSHAITERTTKWVSASTAGPPAKCVGGLPFIMGIARRGE
jgi:hypothetical protein